MKVFLKNCYILYKIVSVNEAEMLWNAIEKCMVEDDSLWDREFYNTVMLHFLCRELSWLIHIYIQGGVAKMGHIKDMIM